MVASDEWRLPGESNATMDDDGVNDRLRLRPPTINALDDLTMSMSLVVGGEEGE